MIHILRLIEMGIDGFSTTVFCYGQTGSGKTHTLTGPPYLVGVFFYQNTFIGIFFDGGFSTFLLQEIIK
jgi:hypothetical protein